MGDKLGMGMVGGGIDSFIGEVHRMAARLDNQIELICGALSSTGERSLQSGKILGLNPERIYRSYHEMINKEVTANYIPSMAFVSIVTPNHLHYQPARLALESGFHVMVDKPLTHSVEEAYNLRQVVKATGKLFGITYTYAGYPMVKEARYLISNDTFGKIRKVNVDYPQGWLTRNIESEKQKQASWRVDPAKSGKGGAMGDIGTHVENIIHYTTGLEIEELCADLSSRYNRKLDDDASILLRFTNGASGSVRASQVLSGEENSLKISVYGENGSLEWSHTDPNSLILKWIDKPTQVYKAGAEKSYLSRAAKNNMRLPSGHPEGFIEAFANIYRNFAYAIKSVEAGKSPDLENFDFPGIEDGLRGMVFIETVVASSNAGCKWKKFEIK
ncbi:MAG TPA: Gfo/Idh/MocA family oxidoreductase [Cyclobacteriaceae bacterium]|jgi:predicted dehydrogenase